MRQRQLAAEYIAQRRRGAESYRSFNEAATVSRGIR